jgi:putative restriction endonuclease
MKKGQRLWTREELILAINLYAKIPFGQMDRRNRQVQELASLIDRTPGAVARRLANFASMDPSQKARGIRGLTNAGPIAENVWNEFYHNWDIAFEESERLLAKYKDTSIEKLYDLEISEIEKGIEKERMVKTRINQYRFRQLVMTNYNSTCCITGIHHPELLIASHITSWSKYENNRLNPMNGLCLNALHDKAFDNGLITISAVDYTIQVSSLIKKKGGKEIEDYFGKYEGKSIFLPKKFLPGYEFLKIHNESFIN